MIWIYILIAALASIVIASVIIAIAFKTARKDCPPAGTCPACPACPPPCTSDTVKIKDDWLGKSIVNSVDWSYDTGEYNHGSAAWVSSYDDANTNNLIEINDDSVKLKVGTVDTNGRLPSIKLKSTTTYNYGVFAISLDHIPAGMSTWPAFWLVGPNWPQDGEIDIIEGANSTAAGNNKNQSTLHTSAGCEKCDAPNGQATGGCGQTWGDDTFGYGFNAKNGGVFVCRLTEDGQVSLWLFEKDNAYISSNTNSMDMSRFPKPDISFNKCTNYFKNLSIILNTNICGDWAGNTGSWSPSTNCNDYIKNALMDDAYWSVNWIKTFQ